jgi:3-oxoacyl-[acyl-carrier protein] reductase
MANKSPTESSAHLGKIALVTGASRGIGRAIAIQLAGDGADVMVTARDQALLEATAIEIRKMGRRAGICSIDLRGPEAGAKVVAATIAAFGGVDILVNNAGATKRGDFLALTDDDWSDGFALKLHGAVRLTRAAWPELKKRRGSIVNIVGVGGRTPGADFAIGGAVNGALLSLTKALADAGVRDGIQVNAINPGYIRTDRFVARMQRRAAETGENLDQTERSVLAEENIVRIGEPEDIAHLVSFVASFRGRFLQGALIDADGGQTKTV